MPKSGSTYLSYALAEVTGYRHSYLGCAYGNVEQELYLPTLIDAYGTGGTVVQQHFKANRANLDLLRQFSITPVIMLRNIFDAMVSVRDHLVQENLNNLPGVFVSPSFRGVGIHRQIDFVIDVIAPWYITYYVSWHDAESHGFPCLRLSYEDIRNNWSDAVVRVLHYHGMDVSDDSVTRGLDAARRLAHVGKRLNKGIVGRGEGTLSRDQCDRVRRLASYYPTVDFSQIGL